MWKQSVEHRRKPNRLWMEVSGQPPMPNCTYCVSFYLQSHQMSQCSDNIDDMKRACLILDDDNEEEQPEFADVFALSGVIERWELLQAQSGNEQDADPRDPPNVTSDLDEVISWLDNIHPELDRLQQSHPSNRIVDMATRAKEMKEMKEMFTHYKPIMLSVNLRALQVPEQQEKLVDLNQAWSRASTLLHQWETSLRRTLMRCQEFDESLHSLLLWLACAEKKRDALLEELLERRSQQASLHTLWFQLQPEDGGEGSHEAQEKLHVTATKLKLLLKDVSEDLNILHQRLVNKECLSIFCLCVSVPPRGRRDSSPPRSFFCRVLWAAVPFHLLLLFLLLLPCLVPQSERDSSCTVANNFARSFHPMLHYTNGPPPT
uniref:KASH domain-containing protein n=1 Tax=Hippocampus comes TaxID=109280 RepID=A0A3Q2XSU1_HIPCM